MTWVCLTVPKRLRRGTPSCLHLICPRSPEGLYIMATPLRPSRYSNLQSWESHESCLRLWLLECMPAFPRTLIQLHPAMWAWKRIDPQVIQDIRNGRMGIQMILAPEPGKKIEVAHRLCLNQRFQSCPVKSALVYSRLWYKATVPLICQ